MMTSVTFITVQNMLFFVSVDICCLMCTLFASAHTPPIFILLTQSLLIVL